MMKINARYPLAIAGLLFSAWNADAVNLLKNPGFEDPENWTAGWKIENLKGTIRPYYYKLDSKGGGHADATPRTGKTAIEIYCDGRCRTRLSQKVSLKPGKYRFGLYVRTNGSSHKPQIEISVGRKKETFYVISNAYRFYYLDFEVKTPSEVDIGIIPREGGIAFDDASLQAFPIDEEYPYLFFDLYPVTGWGNVRHFFSGQLQWIDFALTCIDKKKYSGTGTMYISCPEDVSLEGLNVELLNRWKPKQIQQIKVAQKTIVRQGKPHIEYSFMIPRFVDGYSRPLDFGGFWVRPRTDSPGPISIRLEDRGKIIYSTEITLKALTPPGNYIPRRLISLCYHVQWWRQALAARLEAIPPQFLLMGFNAWNDYMILPSKNRDRPTADETVMLKAYKDYGIRNFYFTFSQLYPTRSHYPDLSQKTGEKNVYALNKAVTRRSYNMRYMASNGKAWRDSALEYWYQLARRPAAVGLPPYTGVINNAMEEMVISYDPVTLAEFAAERNLPLKDLTIANLNGKYKTEWIMYNQRLFNEICTHWARRMKEASPGILTGNSLGPFGPRNSRNLNPGERIAWAQKYYDYKLPQLYHNLGSGYLDRLNNGLNARLYGKENGYADMLPILLVSMGELLHDLEHLRFMVFDILSHTSKVKGFCYYMGSYAFADARIMLEISRINSLTAKLEDYYIDGKRIDGLTSFVSRAKEKTIRAMDAAGYTAMSKLKVQTQPRLHLLNRNGRIALITVLSRSKPPRFAYGDTGMIRFNLPKILSGKNRNDYRLIDWIHGKILPCQGQLPLDTSKDGHLAIFEIVHADAAEALLNPGKVQEYKK